MIGMFFFTRKILNLIGNKTCKDYWVKWKILKTHQLAMILLFFIDTTKNPVKTEHQVHTCFLSLIHWLCHFNPSLSETST